MKNILQRILVATPLAATFVYVNVSSDFGRIPFLLFVGFLMHLTLSEILNLAGTSSLLKIEKVITHLSLGSLIFISWLPLYQSVEKSMVIPNQVHTFFIEQQPDGSTFFFLFFLCMVLLSTIKILHGRIKNSLSGLATPIFSIFYIVTLFYCYTQLLVLDLYYVVIVAVGTFIGDTTMLIGGKLIGRKPIGKGVSPNKTWEGYAVGLPGTFLVVWITDTLYRMGANQTPNHGFNFLVITSFLIYVFTILGDLIESSFKRGAQVKDSGKLPGHGGFLDMFDSMAFTVPVVWFWVRFE